MWREAIAKEKNAIETNLIDVFSFQEIDTFAFFGLLILSIYFITQNSLDGDFVKFLLVIFACLALLPEVRRAKGKGEKINGLFIQKINKKSLLGNRT